MRLYVSSTALFAIDGWVRLLQDNDAKNTLVADLNSYLAPPDAQHLNKKQMISFVGKVTEVRP